MKPVRAFLLSFGASLTVLAAGTTIVSAALDAPPEQPRTPRFTIPSA